MSEKPKESAKPEEKSEGGTASKFMANMLDEAAKEGAEAVADLLHNSLSPELKAKLKKRAGLLSLLRIVRFILPGQATPWGHSAGEFVSDLVSNFRGKLQGEKQTEEVAHAVVEAQKQEQVARVNKVVEIALAVSELDEATRNDFEEWWLSSDDRRNAFLKLVAQANEEQIKKLASRPVPELDRLITACKPAEEHSAHAESAEEEATDWTEVNNQITENTRNYRAETARLRESRGNNLGIVDRVLQRLVSLGRRRNDAGSTSTRSL